MSAGNFRGNARLASLYNPFHPAVVRLLHAVATAGREAGREVSVCGEFAAHPLGAFLLIGLGMHSLSVGPTALAEIKKVIRSVHRERARIAVQEVLGADTAEQIIAILQNHLQNEIELDRFSALANLWSPR